MRRIASLIILVSLVLSGCAEEEVAGPPPLRSVRYIVASDGGAESARTFGGLLRAGNESRLSFQVPGRVEKVNVKLGDQVTQGQVIASLDPTDFQLQLSEAQASLAQARAQARSAEANYERVRKLYASQNASRQDLDNARAQRDATASALAGGNQSVRRLRRQMEYAELTAPGDGTISSIDLEASEIVGAGRVVAVVQVGEQLEVEVNVPESFIATVKRGDVVDVVVDAANGAHFSGKVVQVGSRGQSVFPIIVRLEGDTSALRAGMASSVKFPSKAAEKGAAIVVPITSVGEDRDGRFVYTVEGVTGGEGTLKRRPVEIGELTDRGIDIKSGVDAGMLVVTAGVSRVHDGLKVRVLDLAADGEPSQAKPDGDDAKEDGAAQ